MSLLLRWYMRVLHKHPKKTQFLTTGLLMGSGDLVSQVIIERRKIHQVEPQRIIRFTIAGTFFVGPALHTWYHILEKIVGNLGKTAGLKKILLDQIFFAPCILVSFLIVIGALQFQPWQNIKTKIHEDYFRILKRNYMLWPAAQVINFYIMPLQMRVIFASFVAFLWNIYLASQANQTFKETDE